MKKIRGNTWLYREDAENERKNIHIKNTKQHLREYYSAQIEEKKKRAEFEKKYDDLQIDMWKSENEQYFEKEKENTEKVNI